jgi:hypothetical protein
MGIIYLGKTHPQFPAMRRVLPFAATVLMFTTLVGCEFCETRGTITFDNTRLWCNCDIEFPNGDEYVVFAGEAQTYDFFRGTHTFHIDCGPNAYGNDWTCSFEDDAQDFSFTVDCEDEIHFDLNY